jgi:hypothetical protein
VQRVDASYGTAQDPLCRPRCGLACAPSLSCRRPTTTAFSLFSHLLELHTPRLRSRSRPTQAGNVSLRLLAAAPAACPTHRNNWLGTPYAPCLFRGLLAYFVTPGRGGRQTAGSKPHSSTLEAATQDSHVPWFSSSNNHISDALSAATHSGDALHPLYYGIILLV